MKKISAILGVIAAVALSALPAFAATSYSRSPAGATPASPLSITVSADAYSDFDWHTGDTGFWDVAVDTTNNGSYIYFSACVPSSTLSHTFTISLPPGTTADAVEVYGFYTSCSAGTSATISADDDAFDSTTQAIEGDYSGTIFTIAGGVTMFAMPILPTGTARLFAADAAATAGDPGVIRVLAVAVGIPLAFLVLHYLLGLVPSISAHRKKYGEFG